MYKTPVWWNHIVRGRVITSQRKHWGVLIYPYGISAIFFFQSTSTLGYITPLVTSGKPQLNQGSMNKTDWNHNADNKSSCSKWPMLTVVVEMYREVYFSGVHNAKQISFIKMTRYKSTPMSTPLEQHFVNNLWCYNVLLKCVENMLILNCWEWKWRIDGLLKVRSVKLRLIFIGFKEPSLSEKWLHSKIS